MEYKVDDRAKKAALFFLACDANHITRLLIPAAMRAKGYSNVKASDQIFVQQVRRESQTIKSQKYSLSQVSGRVVATDPGNSSDGKKVGTSDGHAKSDSCSHCRGGWD